MAPPFAVRVVPSRHHREKLGQVVSNLVRASTTDLLQHWQRCRSGMETVSLTEPSDWRRTRNRRRHRSRSTAHTFAADAAIFGVVMTTVLRAIGDSRLLAGGPLPQADEFRSGAAAASSATRAPTYIQASFYRSSVRIDHSESLSIGGGGETGLLSHEGAQGSGGSQTGRSGHGTDAQIATFEKAASNSNPFAAQPRVGSGAELG